MKASADKGVHLQAFPLKPYSTDMLDALASKSGRVSRDTTWSLILVQASHYLALVKYKSSDVVLLDSKAERPLKLSPGSLSASMEQFSLKGLFLLSRQGSTCCTAVWPAADSPVESWLLLPPVVQSEVRCMLSPTFPNFSREKVTNLIYLTKPQVWMKKPFCHVIECFVFSVLMITCRLKTCLKQ